MCVLWKDGCIYRGNGKGELASPDSAVDCAHNIRMRVLKLLLVELHESYHWFLTLPELDHGFLSEQATIIMATGLSKHYNVPRMEATLAEHANKCQVCHKRQAVGLEAPDLDGANDGDKWVLSDEDAMVDDDDSEHEDEYGGHGDEAKLAKFKRRFPDLKNAGVKLRGMGGKEIKPLKMVKKVKMIDLEPRRFEILPRNKCVDFDQYFNGPTLEDQRMFRTDHEGWEPGMIHGKHKPAFRGTGETFRDWGFRILDRKSTRLNSSHLRTSRMPSSA